MPPLAAADLALNIPELQGSVVSALGDLTKFVIRHIITGHHEHKHHACSPQSQPTQLQYRQGSGETEGAQERHPAHRENVPLYPSWATTPLISPRRLAADGYFERLRALTRMASRKAVHELLEHLRCLVDLENFNLCTLQRPLLASLSLTLLH